MEGEQYFQGLSGTVYQIQEKEIASGGEGFIFKLVNRPNQVAKIFKQEKRTRQREEKLRKMVKILLSEEQLQQVTWPQDVIYTQNGFAGYIMPLLHKNENLNNIYAINGNKQNYRKRILIAYNLCVAVDNIHSLGQVCGDMNPQNICVDAETGHVTLIDADSFHFFDKSDGCIYRCEVGLSEYLAPEIQKKLVKGADLRNAALPTYTRETDLFALAVHIFALLMNGCHPFACAEDLDGKLENKMEQMTEKRQESIVLPQPIDNIREGFFPFNQKREHITYPLYAPEFSALPDYLRILFVRTFEEAYDNPKCRVTAEEWRQALKKFASKKEISQCQKGHWYSLQRGVDCPWCAMEDRIRIIIDPPIPPHSGGGGSETGEVEETADRRKLSKPSYFESFCRVWGVLQSLIIYFLLEQLLSNGGEVYDLLSGLGILTATILPVVSLKALLYERYRKDIWCGIISILLALEILLSAIINKAYCFGFAYYILGGAVFLTTGITLIVKFAKKKKYFTV